MQVQRSKTGRVGTHRKCFASSGLGQLAATSEHKTVSLQSLSIGCEEGQVDQSRPGMSRWQMRTSS